MLPINPDNPQARLIEKAVDVLKRGGIICYPTDTVYGIGCDIFNQKAVKRLHQLKGQPKHKPFSFMCCDLKNVSTYCAVSNNAYRLMKKNLPGPYTFVLPTMKIVPKIMVTTQKTVGIRVPASPICQMLIDMLGNPIVTTTAGLPDKELPSSAFEVELLFGSQVDEIIDGGEVLPQPSSVISLVGPEPEVLREGKGDTALFR
ncbi:MAG: L-threonylcarbamoyladenylate synthase [Desulfurivibrionaceae bacterium]|nr:L-threonylcarbamoyladenylate synthase [Desulfurivibrionaceae bacterium]